VLFNSAIFIFFIIAFYLIYWPLPVRWKHTLIITGSFIFYAWFSIPFLLLFLTLVIINYYISQRLLVNKSRTLLGFAIVLDLGVLSFFKYFYLFAETTGSALEFILGPEFSHLANLRRHWLQQYNFEIILPIAISFYTFQIIAWVVDCYRGTVSEKIDLKHFCVFILFFPQFIAGPIMRASDFMHQIDNPTPTRERMINGSLLILLGTMKKVLIADRIGLLTKNIWFNPEQYDAVYLILILPAFLIRIYCDFSGYTDMARGLAKLLGYEIPENFRGPLMARSMTEFWSRWHVTLTTWIRDYIFIPLGGSKFGELLTARNTLITMGLAGLWHGASSTMLLWGLYIGVILVIERFFYKRGISIIPNRKWTQPLHVFTTFILISISCVLFASPSIGHTFRIIKGIVTFQRANTIVAPETLFGLTIFGFTFNFIQYYPALTEKLNRYLAPRYILAAAMVFFIGLLVNLYGDVSGSFIYFAF